MFDYVYDLMVRLMRLFGVTWDDKYTKQIDSHVQFWEVATARGYCAYVLFVGFGSKQQFASLGDV
jgi:hypothetical protein